MWALTPAESAAAGIEQVSLAQLLAESGIVSLHVPLNDSTRGWFDADKISAMRDGAVLVNCARGAIVDNDALAAPPRTSARCRVSVVTGPGQSGRGVSIGSIGQSGTCSF
ncbi:NAD(P)-dependent oxidoreductase [uncultured Parolsenella sp.]|uniref:NAD(P)-dependent oxidoreductase n=1 Tax=uncultured Parolsenella sp. TaxID=2083008 RepID=UPI0027DB9109|nr:NAD(P)-dependent oxidoreductase [uncultured Parolsenella sp.]